MKKNFEYKEPEFKVVVANSEDILTSSGGGFDPDPSRVLNRTAMDHVFVEIEL